MGAGSDNKKIANESVIEMEFVHQMCHDRDMPQFAADVSGQTHVVVGLLPWANQTVSRWRELPLPRSTAMPVSRKGPILRCVLQ